MRFHKIYDQIYLKSVMENEDNKNLEQNNPDVEKNEAKEKLDYGKGE